MDKLIIYGGLVALVLLRGSSNVSLPFDYWKVACDGYDGDDNDDYNDNGGGGGDDE